MIVDVRTMLHPGFYLQNWDEPLYNVHIYLQRGRTGRDYKRRCVRMRIEGQLTGCRVVSVSGLGQLAMKKRY